MPALRLAAREPAPPKRIHHNPWRSHTPRRCSHTRRRLLAATMAAGAWPGCVPGPVPRRDLRRRRDATTDRRAALSRRRQVGPVDRRHRARRLRALGHLSHRRLHRRVRRDLAARLQPMARAAAPTRWWRARLRAWPMAASTCATSCGTWSRAATSAARHWPWCRPTCAWPRIASPTRCTRSSPATRACSPPASPTSPRWPTATRCASPTPTAKAGRWR